jgi:hypothetical protein
MPAQGSIYVALEALLEGTPDIGSARHAVSFAPGHVFTDTRTIAASSNDDLDLNGVLTNALGASVALTKVRTIVIKAAPGNTNDVVVGNATSNGVASIFGATTHTVKIKPGGMLALTAPDATAYAITAGTADILRIANGGAGTSVTYDILILGS